MSATENKEYRLLIMGLLSSQLWLETMDELKETKLYKHDIKRTMNQLEKKIETKLCGDEFAHIYNRDEESFRTYMDFLEKLMGWVAEAPFEDVIDLTKALTTGQLKFEES